MTSVETQQVVDHILASFHTATVECIDVSSPVCDGSKLELTVISCNFKGLPLFKRRQMVTVALNQLRCQPQFKSDIVKYNLLEE